MTFHPNCQKTSQHNKLIMEPTGSVPNLGKIFKNLMFEWSNNAYVRYCFGIKFHRPLNGLVGNTAKRQKASFEGLCVITTLQSIVFVVKSMNKCRRKRNTDVLYISIKFKTSIIIMTKKVTYVVTGAILFVDNAIGKRGLH